MKVLLVHNSYRFAGGEDRAVAEDRELLESHGHQTRTYTRSYAELAAVRSLGGRVRLAADVVWSRRTQRELTEVLRTWRPDVAHFHNIFPRISPSAYAACRAVGVAVVQTLHNYRLVCVDGKLLRDARTCELCLTASRYAGVRHSCYRGSFTQSALLTAAIALQEKRGTWRRDVDAYVALTRFGRSVFVRAGLPPDRIFVRGNALRAPPPAPYGGPRSAIFVGRLSAEKGLWPLLEAWRDVPDVPLAVIGDGPLAPALRAAIARDGCHNVHLLGELPHDEVLERIAGSGMLIFPSIWYEGLGYSLLEALASGRPVIASDTGAQAEVVTHGVNGLLVPPGDGHAIAVAVRSLVADPDRAALIAQGARRVFEERYSLSTSYAKLIQIYSAADAIARGAGRTAA
ncbi:MAG: glycosyltransferase family 4 protein [Chloroflexota bacterium]|nr:glycosyltransferase family 4 protein [Chloroflexota bacterium]